MIKRILSVICIAVMLCVPLAGCSGGDEPVGRTNIVVVLDISDSMTKTDEDGVALWATDFIPAMFDSYEKNEAFENTYFGLVTFGVTAEEAISLTSLATDIDGLREKISRIEYNRQDGTDYYAGFNKAVEMCEEEEAERNIIFVLTDGERDDAGKRNEEDGTPLKTPEEWDNDKQAMKESEEKYKSTALDGTYSVYVVGIDLKTEDAAKREEFFKNLRSMATLDDEGEAMFSEVTDENNYKDELSKIFVEFASQIYKLLDQDADGIKEIESNYENGAVSFTLDKKYKTVSVLIASEEGEPALESVQLNDKAAQTYEDGEDGKGMKMGGFLGINSSTVKVSRSSGNAKNMTVEIKDAKKGEWTLNLNNSNTFSFALIYATRPFPWYWIPIVVIAAIVIILLIMWLCYIPPMRYRKKILPGMLTVERQSADDGGFAAAAPTQGRLIAEIMRGGKYLYHGNMTLATVTGDKRYKKVAAKYTPEMDYMSAMVEFEGNDAAGNRVRLQLFSDSSVQFSLDEGNIIILTWSL